MAGKKAHNFTAEQQADIEAVLAAMDVEYQAWVDESKALDAAERALPIEQGTRWMRPYYYLQMAFMAEIRQIMKARKITQSELARILGVSRARVSKLFGEVDNNITVETMAKLATALDCEVSISVTPRPSAEEKPKGKSARKRDRYAEKPAPAASVREEESAPYGDPGKVKSRSRRTR